MSVPLTTIAECIDLYEASAGAPRVDREAGVIRGVKLLGWKSANGREYKPDGVNPSLYEGRVVNANHVRHGQDRSVYDRFGRTVNVVKRPDGLFGDVEYLKSHPLAGPVTEAAERMPGVFGMSHTAKGRERHGSGGTVIESVELVESVDLVGDPATVAGLYESRSRTMKTLAEVMEAVKTTRPGYFKALKEFAEAGIMSPSSTYAEPAPAPADAAPAEAVDHEAAILDAAKMVLDDDTLDKKAKLKKIKQLLDIVDGGSGGEGEGGDNPFGDKKGGDDGDDAADKKTEESLMAKQTAADVKLLREEMAVRDLVDDAKLSFKKPEARKAFIKSLLPLDEAARKELIAEHAGKTAATEPQKPQSAAGWSADPDAEKKRLEESRKAGAGDPPQLTDEERAKRVASARSIRCFTGQEARQGRFRFVKTTHPFERSFPRCLTNSSPTGRRRRSTPSSCRRRRSRRTSATWPCGTPQTAPRRRRPARATLRPSS